MSNSYLLTEDTKMDVYISFLSDNEQMWDEICSRISDALYARIKEENLTIYDVAEKSGVSYATLQFVLVSRKRNIGLLSLVKLCAFLQVNVNLLKIIADVHEAYESGELNDL